MPVRAETIGDVERLNSGKGQHFFDADTLRFFASKIHEPLIKNRFFITSEKMGFEDTRRESRIRMVRNDGTIETVGDDVRYSSPKAARDALKKAQKRLGSDVGTWASGGVSVRFDPYDTDIETLAGRTERELMRNFYWRCYVGELPVGCRTSRTEARKLATEAVTPCEYGA